MASAQVRPDLVGARFVRREEGRIAAGVAAGVGEGLGIDPTVVRFAFCLLAFAGGLGVILYAMAWLLMPAPPGETPASGLRSAIAEAAAIAVVMAGVLLGLRALGLTVPDWLLWPSALIASGLAIAWRREAPAALGEAGSARSRPGQGVAVRFVLGATLAIAGVLVFATSFDQAREGVLSALTVALGLALLAGPWVMRLYRERDAERLQRIRAAERAEVAAGVHDSVLQTLALIQREAGDPHAVALARRQERELRNWLYKDRETPDLTLAAAIEAAASEVEEVHDIRVEVASAGSAELDESASALVLAAREAMMNAARHAGVAQVAVFVEASDTEIAVFVRDRGSGFDPEAVDGQRRGIAESINGRMDRCGGRAEVRSSPGAGTEVELRLPAVAR